MKKCPNCQKTYDDSLKFCQVDGTPLVAVAEDIPEADPYKTTVASKADLPIPPEEKKPEPEPEPEVDPYATMVAGSKMPEPKEEDVLEVPATPVDPMATMVVSGQTAGNIEIEIPEEEEAPVQAEPLEAPDESSFAEPTTTAEEPAPVPEAPAFTPPPVEERPSAPIPSPFDESMPPGFAPPSTPPFESPESSVEPEPEVSPEPVLASAPVDSGSLPSDFSDVEEPEVEIGDVEPALPVISMGEEIQSASSELSSASPNQTMGYVSLGLGILSMLCCVSILTGPGAIITGYMARGKANSDPENYGGGTMALIGMILGVVGTLLFIAIVVIQLFFGVFAQLLSNF